MLAADLRIASEGLAGGAATEPVGSAVHDDDATATARILRRQQSTCAFFCISILADEYASQYEFRANMRTSGAVSIVVALDRVEVLHIAFVTCHLVCHFGQHWPLFGTLWCCTMKV